MEKLTRKERNDLKQALISEINQVQLNIKAQANVVPPRIIEGSATEVSTWRESAERAYYREKFALPSMKKSLTKLRELLAKEKKLLASLV